jgi:hypothetical protein
MNPWLVRMLLAAPLCAASARAQSPVPTPPAQGRPAAEDPAAEVAALVREHEASPLDFVAKYAQWKPKFEAFAAAHRGTEAELTAQLWLLRETWWLRAKGEMEKTSGPLVDDLLARFANSPQLAKIPEIAYVFEKPKKQPLFEALLASPHRAVQAAAHLGLARLAPPKPGWRAQGAGDPAEAHPHLFLLQSKFADEPYLFTTYGAIAGAMLNPLTPEELAVGAVAPEIVGVDQDGKPLKLSDFRGKVVLLDFWGKW